MELIFRHYETKTFAKLRKLNDKLVKELGGFEQRFDALKAAQWKLKRAKK
jgi:hypothetical protein